MARVVSAEPPTLISHVYLISSPRQSVARSLFGRLHSSKYMVIFCSESTRNIVAGARQVGNARKRLVSLRSWFWFWSALLIGSAPEGDYCFCSAYSSCHAPV